MGKSLSSRDKFFNLTLGEISKLKFFVLRLTICAERSAFCAAVSQGQKSFKAIVVAT